MEEVERKKRRQTDTGEEGECGQDNFAGPVVHNNSKHRLLSSYLFKLTLGLSQNYF